MEKLMRKHENIVLVLSGHDECDYVVLRQDEGDNGNVVSQMLIDPQDTDLNHGGTGLVAMLYFSEDGKNVTVRYYSTVKNKYFMTDNQYSFEMDVIEADNTAPAAPETEINGISFNVSLKADEYEGKVIAALYDETGKVTSINVCNAAENVPVSFESTATGSEIKVFWWNGIDTLVPVAMEKALELKN